MRGPARVHARAHDPPPRHGARARPELAPRRPRRRLRGRRRSTTSCSSRRRCRSPARSARPPRRPRSSSGRLPTVGGSGCTSTIGIHMCGGAVTTDTTARATSSGCIVLKWRWMPKRCQLREDLGEHPEVPVVGEAGERRPDPHDRRADREVLALERERRRVRLEPGLRHAVRPEERTRVHRGVGRDEHDVAGRARDRGARRRRASSAGSARARFVAMIRSCCSSLISWSRPGAAMPALLTSTSIGPSAAVARPGTRRSTSGRHTSSACANGVPPASATSCGGLLELLGAARAERHRPAEPAERDRDRPADARPTRR